MIRPLATRKPSRLVVEGRVNPYRDEMCIRDSLWRLPVSGELRLANSGAAPLVASLAALAEAVPIGEFAVIGGLAVLALSLIHI